LNRLAGRTDEVFGKVAVNETEARAYYESHPGEFTTPPAVTLREILVAVQGDSKTLNVAADEAARQKIETFARGPSRRELREAGRGHVGRRVARHAGLIGPISLDDLAADLRQRIEGMKVGEITPVLRTPQGYQILQLDTKTQAETLPFDQAREQISQRMFTDKRQAEFQKYLERLRSEAIIEWKNAEIKKAFEEGLASPAKGRRACRLHSRSITEVESPSHARS